MIANIKNSELKMWSKSMIPESVQDKDENGKTIFVKTGKKVEFTKYTFRDEFGDVLVLTSNLNDYRSLEGKKVDLEIEIATNDFTGKNKVSLKSISPSK